MSVCLVGTKSIATAALGIYAGMVVTKNLIFRPQEGITFEGICGISDEDSRPNIKLYARVSTALATISTLFYGLSYFPAPPRWKHPYVMYCFIGIPLSLIADMVGSGLLLHSDLLASLKTLFCSNNLSSPSTETSPKTNDQMNANVSISEEHDDIISEDSIVDLGNQYSDGTGTKSSSRAPSSFEDGGEGSVPLHVSTARYFAVITSAAVFTMGVVGCLGEAL